MAPPHDDHPMHAAIHRKLAEIVASTPAPPAWYEAWSRLAPQSTEAERLAVYREVRDSGSVDEDASFFLIAWTLDLLTDERAEEGLREAEERLEAVRQKYGLEENAPAAADGVPEEYRQAMSEMQDAWDALYVATLEEFGEHEMARLFREMKAGSSSATRLADSSSTARKSTMRRTGCTPCWRWSVAAWKPISPMGPLGLRYHEEEGFWEIWIYPTPVELIGGRHDGEVVAPGIALNLERLRECFDSVVAFTWNSLGLNWPEGPHVSIEGVFRGREVYLQVLAYAPEGEEPGLMLDATRRPE